MEWGIDRRWTALAATVLTVPLIQIFVFSVIPDPFVGSFDKMGLFYKSGWRSIGYFLVLTVFSVTVPPALMYASLRSPSRRRSELGTAAALSISAAVLVFVSMYGAGLMAKNVLYFVDAWDSILCAGVVLIAFGMYYMIPNDRNPEFAAVRKVDHAKGIFYQNISSLTMTYAGLTLLLSVFLQPHYLCHIFAVTEASAYFLYRHRFLRDLRSGRRKTCGECT